jgi:hypothetical protein
MTERRCNECTLCCKLLPVLEINKGANVRCVHQRATKGCAIYRKENFPMSCAVWSCVWLVDPNAKDLSRPDRSHYVIDPSPDYVEVDLQDGSPMTRISVMQVWLDPKFPDAHRDPALRAYLAMRGERFQQMALIRYNSRDAFTLVPPSMSDTGDWIEQPSRCTNVEHSAADIHG